MLNTDEQIISLMYQGEHKRDASSKIRGFLFQDLIAIDELLEDEVEYVCTEYVEDVVVAKKTEIVIIQVKYYPKSDANLKEIIRDLYYQFLRLQVYEYKGTVIPQLSIYSKKAPSKPTLEQLKCYIGIDLPEKPNYDVNDIDEVYKNDKDKAQQKCFDDYAYNGSMERFLEALVINTKYQFIGEYRNNIENKIDQIIKKHSTILDENIRKSIAMGLAIRFVQDSYNDDINYTESELQKKKRSRNDFMKYLQDNTCLRNEECISAYLQGVVYEIWSEKEVDNPNLSQKQMELLHVIVGNTANWLFELCINVQGQRQLVNTISRKNSDHIDGFEDKDIEARFTIIKEHRSELEDYLCFLWKILFNINQDLISTEFKKDFVERLRIENYIDADEKRIIQLKFVENMPKSVLLSGAEGSRPAERIKNILNRMKKVKPETWYLCGKYKGYFSYGQKVSDITHGLNVASIIPEVFKIECMNCITVDYGEWNIIDDCKNTIFNDRCVEEKTI